MEEDPLWEMFESDSSSDSDYDLEIVSLAILQQQRQQQQEGYRRRQCLEPFPSPTFIRCDRIDGHTRLYRDYFADQPVFPLHYFRKRYRMRRNLYLRIQDAVVAHDEYFVQKRNAAGTLGLSSLQKVTAVMRMLAYGVPADAVDDYVRIGASTSYESLKRFTTAVVEIFGDEYLRAPKADDISRLLSQGEDRGFPGMLGSLDCMHWKWKNCPVSWKGMYQRGDVHDPSIILEAVASHDLWIWHAFFGMPGSHNDINVLDRSPLFTDLAAGRAPVLPYTINGNNYTMGYYLADGIYPPWSTIVKTIPNPQGNKHKHFAKMQESVRKDVERAFGVLQARFHIIRGPARFFDEGTLADIMKACIIMHNMIVEDERVDDPNYVRDFNYDPNYVRNKYNVYLI